MDDGLQAIGVRVALYSEGRFIGSVNLPPPIEVGDAVALVRGPLLRVVALVDGGGAAVVERERLVLTG